MVVTPGREPWGAGKGGHQRAGSAQPGHTYSYAWIRFVCVLVISEINIFKSSVSWRSLIFITWNTDVFSRLSLGYCAFGYSQARWRFCHSQLLLRAIGLAVGCSFVFPAMLAGQGAVDRAGQPGAFVLLTVCLGQCEFRRAASMAPMSLCGNQLCPLPAKAVPKTLGMGQEGYEAPLRGWRVQQ